MRRQSPQRASPESSTNASDPPRRSPQIAHKASEIGCIDARQSSHTGSREMFIRGLPQRRQSEGNNVANKAAATPFMPETKEEKSELSRLTSLASAARVGFVLLLKTTLPRPAATVGAPAGRISFSIAVGVSARNAPAGSKVSSWSGSSGSRRLAGHPSASNHEGLLAVRDHSFKINKYL